MHILVAGCGWLGESIALACLRKGDRVTGVRRDLKRAAGLAALGIEPLQLDLSDPTSAGRIPDDVEAIVACQAAGADGVEPYRRAYVDANRVLLDAARRLRLRAYVYTSSTGVFGQEDGSDVDETTAPAPASPSAQVLADAEREVLSAHEQGVPTRLLRLSGLYGPGRTGVIDRVRSGRMALGPGDDTWTNWCHLEDAVQMTLAILARGRSGGIYHGSDARPARRREVVAFVAGRLGIAAPRAREDDPDSASRRGANRRIHAERTRAELGITLCYPSFREGLGPHLIAARE